MILASCFLIARNARPRRPQGRALADHARKTLDHFAAARAVATGALVQGKLTVGAVPTTLSSILPQALARLRRLHPELRIEIRSDSSAGLAARLQQGELDIAICTRPDPSPPGLDWHHVATEPFMVIAPADAKGEGDAALLSSLPFIWFNRKTWAGRAIEAELHRRKIPLSIEMETDSLEAISSLVAAGLGAAIVPVCRGARSFPAGVRAVPFGEPPFSREVGALVAPEGAPAALIETFLEALRH